MVSRPQSPNRGWPDNGLAVGLVCNEAENKNASAASVRRAIQAGASPIAGLPANAVDTTARS